MAKEGSAITRALGEAKGGGSGKTAAFKGGVSLKGNNKKGPGLKLKGDYKNAAFGGKGGGTKLKAPSKRLS